MRRLFWSAVLFIALALVTYVTLTQYHVRIASAAPLQVAPFTLEFWEYDSAGRLVDQRTTARRADGSEVMVMVSPTGRTVRRIDYLEGSSVALFDALQIKMSGYVEQHNMEARRRRLASPPPNCLEYGEQLQDRGLEGTTAIVTILRSSVSFRLTEKRAPAYACQVLAALGEDQQPDGSWARRFEARFVYLQPGDPDSRLFSAGGTYKEMPPSEIRKAGLQNAGITPQQCPSCFTRSFAAMDEAYNKAQHR